MKMKVIAACLSGLFFAPGGFAAVTTPDPNPTMDGYLTAIAADAGVQAVISQFLSENEERFIEHMEITRIASPSRQEYYRAKELYDRLKAFGFTDDELIYTGKDNSGILPGAAVQQVDGLKVYMTCAIIKGAWNGATDGTGGVYARPKVVIEGHIDTVNPAEIPDFDPDKKPNVADAYFEPIKMQPIYENGAATTVIEDRAQLAAIEKELNFDANGKIIKDANYDIAKITYNTSFGSGDGSTWDAAMKAAYRLYVPGYADAMGNTIGVYHMAKLFKTNNVKPVYDVWFCGTAGEEGRGNLAGMKQLYGYNQDNAAADPADNGKNKLNIVANLSIDGGNGTFNYLGSYRYEVNYKGTDLAVDNGAREAARRIARLADVKSPSEDGTTTNRTTYTVGIAYKKDDGSTSFEIDMRSPVVPDLNEMKSRLYPKFGSGTTTSEGVEIKELWYGDRPAHVHPDDLVRTDPMIYAIWKARGMVFGSSGTLSSSSSSLNDNIPAAMNIPTSNLNIHATSATGGNHAFNEWGIRGNPTTEVNNMTRVLYSLLAVAGLADSTGATIVPAAYGPVAPGHVNDVWDSEDIWKK
jgi:acetylornithine deacetylase/succinyl-diaminopimelate desuccinylase-like protein